MDQDTMQSFLSSLRQAKDAVERAMGARLVNIQWQHQLDYQFDQITHAFDALAQARTTAEELRDELPKQDPESHAKKASVKVKAHKRGKHSKPRTLEEAGGDPSKLQSVEEAIENGMDMDDWVKTERKHKGLPPGVGPDAGKGEG